MSSQLDVTRERSPSPSSPPPVAMKFPTSLLLLSPLTVLLAGSFGTAFEARSRSRLSSKDINDDPTVNVDGENTRPIIGILTQEVSRLILRTYPDRNFTSYIAASYVKFVEGAGGRVVPIWIGQARDYYEDIMTKVNGVLLPGGATFFNQSDGYADAGRHLYQIAMDMNENGQYMPVWGTCLGFELLIYLSVNGTDPRSDCASSSQALPLEFKSDFRLSRLFHGASDEVVDIFQKHPVTANFHMYCFTEETFAELKLNESWRVMSINHDWNGQKFISTVEHRKYPFYGVQFHPEKNLYEFVPNRNITHTSLAIRTSQYLADFFVAEARRSQNHFENKSEEVAALIYNYQPEYTGAVGSAFVQQYLFEGESELRSGVVAVAANRGLLWLLPIALIALTWCSGGNRQL